MLNGIDPIIIFNLKLIPPSLASTIAKIPVVADVVAAIDLPLIPIYLSEKLTGVFIESESKSMDIDTDIDTLSNGDTPNVNQRGISNTVKIEMVASRNSIGIALFSAMADLIFPRVTSKEYSITYLHGAVTVFGGLLHSFSITQNSDNDLYRITLEIVKPSKKSKVPIPEVAAVAGATP